MEAKINNCAKLMAEQGLTIAFEWIVTERN
ncbi:hypothetical protein ABIB50_001723 [Mucilaginibacter sp. UYCu711]